MLTRLHLFNQKYSKTVLLWNIIISIENSCFPFWKNNLAKNKSFLNIYSPSGLSKMLMSFSPPEQIWRNLALHHLLTIICSEWVPSEWVQIADKHIK